MLKEVQEQIRKHKGLEYILKVAENKVKMQHAAGLEGKYITFRMY